VSITHPMSGSGEGVRPVTYLAYQSGELETVEAAVIDERPVCIFINGKELASVLCTPRDLEDLAVGFAYSEGFIDGMDDVEVMTVSAGRTCVDLWLRERDFDPPARRVITSGCGGGVTFDDVEGMLARQPSLSSDVAVAPGQVSSLMQEVLRSAELYNAVRGVHTSALSDGAELVLVAQDVGRHNTIDRIAGRALREGIVTRDGLLLTSGRISSEMMAKTARMGVPVAISRTSPTALSIELARAWNITLIGYARGERFRIYSAPERVRLDA
jgi:FdhD protein